MPSLPSVGEATFVVPVAKEPDAHGQAALLLVESLLHTLLERAVLTNADAIGVVECAASVKQEVAEAIGESVGTMQASLDLLSRIARSLRADSD